MSNIKSKLESLTRMISARNVNFLTDNYTSESEIVDNIYNNYTELIEIDNLQDNSELLYFTANNFSNFSVSLDIKFISLEKTVSNIINYIDKNIDRDEDIKKVYFLISMAALEDILINSSNSHFAIDLFNQDSMEVRTGFVNYIERDSFSSIIKYILSTVDNFKFEDIDGALIDILANHKELLNIINARLNINGNLLFWLNDITIQLFSGLKDKSFKDYSGVSHLSDVAIYNIRVYREE